MTLSHRKSQSTWFTHDRAKAGAFRRHLKSLPPISEDSIPAAISELNTYVHESGLINKANAMFKEAIDAGYYEDPLDEGAIENWDDFIVQLTKAVQFAPMFFIDNSSPDPDHAAGLVGFPINALVNWPMATQAGDTIFRVPGFNLKMKEVLNAWAYDLLQQPSSTNVLSPTFTHEEPPAIGWLNHDALNQINEVALSADGQIGNIPTGLTPSEQFQAIFEVPAPSDPVMGFNCWDEFFVREFKEGVRPTPNNPPAGAILNACESGPLQYIQNVALDANFDAKGQPYSLSNIFGQRQDLAQHFVGGSIYQAFLSALSYHRWNAPVSGTLSEGYVIDGSYYWENPYEGYLAPSSQADPTAPNDSQPFLSAVAARAVMVIDTDDIGKVAIVTIGMAEVGSNQITAEIGAPITAGDQLGMFHFGGSTHCLIFEPGVEVTFADYVKVTDQPNYASNNVAVRTLLATAKKN